MITKPMLASAVEDISTLDYPVLCTPKLDGIRCLKVGGQALSRNFKPIQNDYVRGMVEKYFPDGVDGELMVPGGAFRDVSSAIMSYGGMPEFVYHVFDVVKDRLDKPYAERMDDLRDLRASGKIPEELVNYVLPMVATSPTELLVLEEKWVGEGYEGVMIRSRTGGYKCGRATAKSGDLLKLKKFLDSEAEIIGFQEKMTNTNFADKDAFGRTKRSTAKDGMVPAGTLGAFLVKDIHNGMEFSMGSGLNDLLRKMIWDDQPSYLGRLAKYKYQGVTKDLPRFPIFLGFRSRDDMGE